MVKKPTRQEQFSDFEKMLLQFEDSSWTDSTAKERYERICEQFF